VTESLDAVIAEFLRVREAGEGQELRYQELLGLLEACFWEQAEQAVNGALAGAPDGLRFSPAQTLLIDAGLLDVRLVARAGRDFLEKLTGELGAPGEPGILYLSQWLAERHHSCLATGALPAERAGAGDLPDAAVEGDQEPDPARAQRNELYRRAARLFENLPGFAPELSAAIVRGAADDRIEELLQAGEAGSAGEDAAPEGQIAGQAERYDRVVLRALELARERAESDEELLGLETLGKLRTAIFRKSLVRSRRGAPRRAEAGEGRAERRGAPKVSAEEVRRFMQHELGLVRSMLRIGSQEGKAAQTCPVLLYDAPRTTRAAAADVLRLVRELDPRIGLAHNLLIAPFTGSGFFEWERGTLVVALTPARNAEEAVVNAVAHYRLMADARQGSGSLAGGYQALYGPKFREQFLSDYQAWVLRVGRGRREAISEKSFQFFAEHIGPPAGGPIVPGELARMSVKEREEQLARLETVMRRGKPDAQEYHHLAVLLWQAERIDEAIRVMERAAAAAPEDGRVLYSLGVLCRRRHLLGEARTSFRECTRVALRSLWGIYAHEALRRLM